MAKLLYLQLALRVICLVFFDILELLGELPVEYTQAAHFCVNSRGSLNNSSKRPKKFHEEKSQIFKALAELEREIENVGHGLGSFVQSTESMLERMKSGGK